MLGVVGFFPSVVGVVGFPSVVGVVGVVPSVVGFPSVVGVVGVVPSVVGVVGVFPILVGVVAFIIFFPVDVPVVFSDVPLVVMFIWDEVATPLPAASPGCETGFLEFAGSDGGGGGDDDDDGGKGMMMG